jgi:hypothetical protein
MRSCYGGKGFAARAARRAPIIAIADWVERRRAELDDRDPNERYFVNEALDELANREK